MRIPLKLPLLLLELYAHPVETSLTFVETLLTLIVSSEINRGN